MDRRRVGGGVARQLPHRADVVPLRHHPHGRLTASFRAIVVLTFRQSPMATNHAHRSTSSTDRRSTVGGPCRAHLSRSLRLFQYAREHGRSLRGRLRRDHSGIRNRQSGDRDFRMRRRHRTRRLRPAPMGNRAAVRTGVEASRNPAHICRSAVARQRYRSGPHVRGVHCRGARQRRSNLAWRLGEQSPGTGLL